MATTAANNSVKNNTVNNQYAAVAEYAQQVFNTMIRPNDDLARMSAKEVEKAIAKAVLLWKEDADCSAQHTIQTDGWSMTTTPEKVFGQLVNLESMLKMKKSDRATFAHTYTLPADKVESSCFIPEDIAGLCQFVGNGTYPVMSGVCFDFGKRVLCASDGHVLMAQPMYGLQWGKYEHDSKFIVPTTFLKAHPGQTIHFALEEYDTRYAYVGGERVRLIEGRYPAWNNVIPELDTPAITLEGKEWKEVCRQAKILGKINFNGYIELHAIEGEHTLTIVGQDADYGISQSAEVCLASKIPFDFHIGVKADNLKLFDCVGSMHLSSNDRAIVLTDGEYVGLVMPVLLEGAAQWQAPKCTPAPAPAALAHVERFNPEAIGTAPVCTPAPETQAQPEATTPRPETPAQSAPSVLDGSAVETKSEVCTDRCEALINGTWEPVEALAVHGTRILVKRANGQRAIVKTEEIRGNLVDNRSIEPVCTPAPETQAQPEATTPRPETPVQSAPSVLDGSAAESEPVCADTRIYIAAYSEKAFILTGATKPYRAELKKYGCWNKRKEGWIFSNKRREWVEQLLAGKLTEVIVPVCPPAPETPAQPEVPALPEPSVLDGSAVEKPSKKNKAKTNPMIKQYADLKAKHPDALLLFRCGDFYETYEDDAKAAADILGITLTKRDSIRMAGFPYHALDTYLPKLIRSGKRVAICDQLEAPKTTKRSTSAT